MIIKIFLSFLFVILSFSQIYAYKNISPIVQIVSFWDIYGKTPQMMWWWSASIINNNWIIISNNHVVDDWRWWLSSAFSVCITKEIYKRPICDYTASLINRDSKRDISILKIDEYDIYWNKVNYNDFKSIEIDYDYTPENKNEVIAIWYPWIWADTISETKWIVSWVSEYNWYKYIKTDTLIAWWNSWWALIFWWKLIWIPTFWIWFWDTMWYALLINEAKQFIKENINPKPQINEITKMIDFKKYKNLIENINKTLLLKDDIFDIKIPSWYQINNYIKNSFLNITLKNQKNTWINNINISIEKSPKITTEDELFYYFESKWLYFKEHQKLLKKSISNEDFYYSIEKTDLSEWYSSWGNNYFLVKNWYLINIYIEAPFYDEKINKETRKELDMIFSNININFSNFFYKYTKIRYRKLL